MPQFARWLVVAGLALAAAPAPAAVVALTNITDRPVTFTVSHPGKTGASYTLALGESRLVPAGRRPEVAYQSAGKPVRYRLEPYHAYMFWAEKPGAAVEFHGIDLAGAMPKPDDVPADPPAAAPLRLPVALLADNANPRTRAAWEKAYRARVAAVSDILTRQCGVGLSVMSVGEWRSDPATTDLAEQLKAFEKAAPAVPNTLAVGFTSRVPADPKSADHATGFTRGPSWPYLLVRDGQLRTEPERTEALLREVAHHLGAAHTPDPLSAVRGSLADGPGPAGPAPVGIDALNLLAVGIWVEELRAGPVKSFADLKPVSRERLAVVYKTLSGLLPTDPLAADHLASLEKIGEPGAVAAADPPRAAEVPKPAADPPEPAKPAEDAKPNDRTAAARKVVRAVTLKAVDLRRDPDAEKARGDALTVELLMAAGDAAMGLDEAVRVPAFLIGIGVALDHSDLLRANPIVGRQVRAVETEAERAERLAALGNPTLRGRRDLCQHFVVSAALTALVGSGPAEAAGLAKELLDRGRASGFSFADLQADLAGIQLALALAKHPPAVGRFRDGVDLADYMPPIAGLKEGLPAEKFAELYGDLNDPRFKAEMDATRKRVAGLPKYKEIAELKGK